MKKNYCAYCGELLIVDNCNSVGCNCERVIAESAKQFIEDQENSPETQYGWAQQDLIDLRRRER